MGREREMRDAGRYVRVLYDGGGWQRRQRRQLAGLAGVSLVVAQSSTSAFKRVRHVPSRLSGTKILCRRAHPLSAELPRLPSSHVEASIVC